MENKEIIKHMQELIKKHKQTINRSAYMFSRLPEEMRTYILLGCPEKEEIDYLLKRQES